MQINFVSSQYTSQPPTNGEQNCDQLSSNSQRIYHNYTLKSTRLHSTEFKIKVCFCLYWHGLNKGQSSFEVKICPLYELFIAVYMLPVVKSEKGVSPSLWSCLSVPEKLFQNQKLETPDHSTELYRDNCDGGERWDDPKFLLLSSAVCGGESFPLIIMIKRTICLM